MTDLGTLPLPHNRDAEESLLSSMLIDNSIITDVITTTPSDVFYLDACRKVYIAITESYTRHGMVDLVTVMEVLKNTTTPGIKTTALDEVGGVYYLAGLADMLSSTVYYKAYLKIVKEKYDLRMIALKARQVVEACYTKAGDIGVEGVLSTLQNASDYAPLSLGGDLHNKSAELGSLAMGLSGATRTTIFKTGLASIDNHFPDGGVTATSLVIIAARPAMGKTILGTEISFLAAESGKYVLFVSLEMAPSEIYKRLLALDSGISLNRLTPPVGNRSSMTWNDLLKKYSTMDKLRSIPLEIYEGSTASLSDIVSQAKDMHREKKLDMICIDYLQLIDPGAGKGGTRQEQVSHITRELKKLAMALEVPIFVISQLSRAVESRPDKRPTLSDLRESGAIEQDADVVLLLYRDEYYNKETTKPGVAEVIVAKARSAQQNVTIEMGYDGARARFSDLQKERQP